MLNAEHLKRGKELFENTIIPAMKEAERKAGKPIRDIRSYPPEVVMVFEMENGEFAVFGESYASHQPLETTPHLSQATHFTKAEQEDVDFYLKDMANYRSKGLSFEDGDGGSVFQYHKMYEVTRVRELQLTLL